MPALLLDIDFINDICDPRGATPLCAEFIARHETLARVNEAIAFARLSPGLLHAHVRVGFSPDYLDCPATSPMFSALKRLGSHRVGTWGDDFCEALDARSGDRVLLKRGISAFAGTELAVLLAANRVSHLVLCGVSTTWAIESTAREAHDHCLEVTVLSDASGAAEDSEHDETLRRLSRIVRVMNVADWLATDAGR